MKMLEIILVIMIIGIFATVITPKLANIVDIAVIDREAKRLGSEINLLQTIGRTVRYNPMIFSVKSPKEITLRISETARGYAIFQGGEKPIRDWHYLPNNITIRCNKEDLLNIKLNSFNKIYQSGHITLKSKLNQRFIIIDSAGRWRISTELD